MKFIGSLLRHFCAEGSLSWVYQPIPVHTAEAHVAAQNEFLGIVSQQPGFVWGHRTSPSPNRHHEARPGAQSHDKSSVDNRIIILPTQTTPFLKLKIDLNSLSDMNNHDCFDSFVCFWLPATIIYNRHRQYQEHRHLINKWMSHTCSPMFPQPLFPDATAGQFFGFR